MSKATAKKASKAVAKTSKTTAKPTKNSNAVSPALRSQLAAVANVASPVIPVDRLVGEARALVVVATSDEAALAKVGLQKKLVPLLSEAADALTHAQAALLDNRRTQRSAREVELEQQGIALRSEMVADGRFALREDADAQTALDTIVEGEGLDDEIQDLRELDAFFRSHASALKRIGVSASAKARSAIAIAKELELLLATRRAAVTRKGSEPVEARDRASTLVDSLMREIRTTGVYAFRNDSARQAKYRSAFRALKRAQQKRSRARPTAPAKPPAATGTA